MGMIGAITAGQAPEIVTQYEQRLGGAIDELRTVIDQFDTDVAKNGLDRVRALAVYQKSNEPFLRDRGVSMRAALKRYEKLNAQRAAFQTMNGLYKPVYLFRAADQPLLKGVLDAYQIGLPATSGGALYGFFGGVAGFLFGGLLLSLSGLDTRRNKTATGR